MAKAVVTQARVFEVAQALTDQGTAPTPVVENDIVSHLAKCLIL